jgi:hypothetical protein
MSVSERVSDILTKRVTFELESIDRMYLNAYVGGLQIPERAVRFFRSHRGYKFASSILMDQMTKNFVAATEQFAQAEQVPMITFGKGQRKDDITAAVRKRFDREEGVMFIGKAQEYFPFNAKVCLNGHEWLNQQLASRAIEFEPLDNGVLSCVQPALAQELRDGFDSIKIEAVFRKWLARLPHPFNAEDRQAGYRYELSVLQSEFSRTMVFDRPMTGRVFFDQVIRENLDLGRPDQVRLIFDRRVSRRTPGRFHTRVVTEGVIPRFTSSSRVPGSRRISNWDVLSAWRPPSTTPVPSCTISLKCGSSALRPTDVC